jgi:hypothetical protein
MRDAVVIHLPIARLAEIERARTQRGKVERVAFLDEVPLRVARADAGSAPVALASVGEDGRPAGVWRACGGRLYRPLWPCGLGDGDGIGIDVAGASREMALRAKRDLERSDGYWAFHNGEQLLDTGFLRGADQGRGMGPEGHHPVRRTIEDGRAAQAAAAARIAEGLLIVDGGLHHVAPFPGWRVDCRQVGSTDPATGLDGFRTEVSTGPWLPRTDPRRRGEPDEDPGLRPWMTFGPERQRDADAMAQALAQRLGEGLGPAARPVLRLSGQGRAGFRVMDQDALDSARPPDGPDAWTERAGQAFLADAARFLGRLPLDAAEDYLTARRAVEDVPAAGGHAEAFASVEAFARHVRGLGAAHTRLFVDGANVAAHAVGLRYALFERHRHETGRDAGDLLSLASLAPR